MKDLRTQLETFEKQIEQFRTKARTTAGQARLELERQIHQMESKAKQARDKIKEMESASGEALKEMKAGVSASFAELKDSCERASSYFR